MSNVVDEKTLLKYFRYPESTATDDERALRLLSRHPHPEQLRVEKIRDQKVDYYSDHYQFSLLHYACRNGWYDVSRELVDKYQCDPHLENRRKYTPLHCACEGGNMDIVNFLVGECHCDPRVKDNDGDTPLHCACKGGNIDIVRFLTVDHHCDPACCGR